LESALHNHVGGGSAVVRSESFKRVLQQAEQVARHRTAVLIEGETGTGKEMIARAIHDFSLRCNGPLIDVNCSAIPEHLVESELFGYEKGAFSGADAVKPGLFELADEGTLFLDEIGDLDLKVQVKLLRVLDGVPYYRLGGCRKVNVNVRIVAATNQCLEEMVKAGRFRGDLYHRLAQFKLEIPPLRERPDDLLEIAEQSLHEFGPGAYFGKDAIAALLAYSWPGNVRELKNTIFKAVMQAQHPRARITAMDLCLPVVAPPANNMAAPMEGGLDQVERQMILQALEKCGGNQGKAALALGISRRTLVRKLKTYRESTPDETVAPSPEQQRCYRAQVNIPIRMKYASEEFEGTLLNISVGGAAVAVQRALRFGVATRIYFRIPGSQRDCELCGHIAWSSQQGNYGIQFDDLPAKSLTDMQRWLQLLRDANTATTSTAP